MTESELHELGQLLTTAAVASRLRGNRHDTHLEFAGHLLASLRASQDPGNKWGLISESGMTSDLQDHKDYCGDIVAHSIFATHYTITFTYRN